jgi:choline dehydrogenase-like flavoprotein
MRDVIIIGAGGGGAVAAKELAGRGLDVLVLEGGPRHAKPATTWSHFENDAQNPATGFLRVGPPDRSKPGWFRELTQPSYLWQVAGVGGTTLHYFGNSPRAMPGAFRGYTGPDRDSYDRAHEFPFSYADLIPYYEWVEATLPVQTAAMDRKAEVFFSGCERIGLTHQTSKDIGGDAFRPQENAILQPKGTAGTTSDPTRIRFPKARGCTFCGHCFTGCYEPRGAPRNQAARRSTDNSYVPMALTADAWQRGGRAVTLIAGAYVTKLHTTGSGAGTTACGVTWRDTANGAKHTERARVVVLAGGAVENPRLWLNSRLPNPNGWVGRGFTDRHFDVLTGVFPFATDQTKGPMSTARAEFPGHGCLQDVGLPPGTQAFGAGFSDSGIVGAYDNGAPVGTAGADTVGRLVGNDLRALMANGIDQLLNIAVIVGSDVEDYNVVDISPLLPADEHGPIPRVEFLTKNRSARTKAKREFLAAKSVQILRAAGATKVHRWNFSQLMLHCTSSMRMGLDPANSVLRTTGESRAVRRLFVADNSALPNGLGGPNPTLTTQALATRTAEQLFMRYFDGDPWVDRETPVVSTARAVTHAVVARGL